MNLKKINFRNPNVTKGIFILLIGVLLAVAWYKFVYADKREEKIQLEKTKKQKQETLNNILAMKPELERIKVEIAAAQQRLDSLKSIFPDQKEIPRLIREITREAFNAGIHTTKFHPLPDIVKEYYIENRYSLSMTGGYHQLGVFFSNLANLPLIVNLSSVKIADNPQWKNSRDDNAEYIEEGGQSLVASFEMTTFSSKQ
jgi:type IV pilus assembly protein PilO